MYDSLMTYLTLALLMGNPIFAHNDYPLVTLTKPKKTSHHENCPISSVLATSKRKHGFTKNKDKQIKTTASAIETFSYIIAVNEDIKTIESVTLPFDLKTSTQNALISQNTLNLVAQKR